MKIARERTALTGGGSDALDGIPYNDCNDGDFTITITGGKVYIHEFDASSTDSEVVPQVIAPDDVGSNPGRWILKAATDETHDLEGAVSLAGSEEKTITIATNVSISDDLTVPSNITLKFIYPGKVTVPASKTLTINGAIEAGNWKIFDGDGIAKVSEGRINVVWYATEGNGSSSSKWKNALRRAFEANGDYKTYYCPKGYYQDDTTIDINTTEGYVRIIGEGREQTIFYYAKTDGSPLLRIRRLNGTERCCGIEIKDIGFNGLNTATGAGIELVDISHSLFQRLYFRDFSADNTTSCGIHLKGRDTTCFKDIRMYKVKKGFVLDTNPNHSTLHVDNMRFQDIYVDSDDTDDGYGIYAICSNMYRTHFEKIFSANAKACFYWVTNEATSISSNIIIDDINDDGNGDTIDKDCWLIYISNSDQIRSLDIKNCWGSETRNGIYISGGGLVTLKNNAITAGSGYTTVDVSNCELVLVENCFFNENGTSNFPSKLGLESIGASHCFGIELYAKTTVPRFEFSRMKVPLPLEFPGSSKVNLWVRQATLNDDQAMQLPDATYGVGFALACDGGNVEEWGMFVYNSDGTVTLLGTAGSNSVVSTNTVNSDTDGKFCIVDAGTYPIIKNRLGATKDVWVIVFYRTT